MTDTDELIETLERLEKEATPRPWKLFHDEYAPAVDYIERDMGDDRRAQGLEDPILHACLPREGDLPLIVSLRNHLPALISALKENKRMREALTVFSDHTVSQWAHPSESATTIILNAGVIARAALQPQGEK